MQTESRDQTLEAGPVCVRCWREWSGSSRNQAAEDLERP